jgi:hypothetical protein
VAVCLVAVLAILSGWMVAYRLSFPPERRAYSVGMASASILIDTPKSQVVAVDPEGSDTLAVRASVLSNLMVDGAIKGVIAQRAGLPPDKLIASTETAAVANPQPLDARSHVVTTSLAQTSDMSELPIIRVQTQAPDVQQAIELANAAVAALGEYLDSKAVAETIPEARRLRVRALGTAQGHSGMRGPGRMLAIAVALFVLIAGCALILAMSALIGTWRAAVAFEQDLDWDEAAPDAVPNRHAFEEPRAPEAPIRAAEKERSAAAKRANGPAERAGGGVEQGERKTEQPSRAAERRSRAAQASDVASGTTVG